MSVLKATLTTSLRAASKLYGWSAGGKNRPALFDIDETFPALRVLDQNYAMIRSELDEVLRDRERIPRYHDILEREAAISAGDKNWRVFMLATIGGTPPSSAAKCPNTTMLVNEILGMFNAFFSILDPGKSIPAHCGPYLGYLRYHLALKVPKNNPPSIRIKDHIHTWKEGESIIFDDSWDHEVYNESDDIRVVLIVDFYRPMPLPLDMLNRSLLTAASYLPEEGKGVIDRIEKYAGH